MTLSMNALDTHAHQWLERTLDDSANSRHGNASCRTTRCRPITSIGQKNGGENKKTQVQLKFDEYNAGCHELSSVDSTELNS